MKKTLFIYTLLISICLSFSPVQAIMLHNPGYQAVTYATYEYPDLGDSLFGMTFDNQGIVFGAAEICFAGAHGTITGWDICGERD